VLHSLMKSPLKNQDFVLVAENSSYKNFLEKLIQTHQLPGRGKHLSKGVLKGLWLVDSVLALLRIKPKTLSKGLVQTLSETSTYDGQKILAALPKFGYQPLEATLIEVIKKD
jgi:dihydroflavonol-4-reductase